MLSNQGIDVLIDFAHETGVEMITRSMTEEQFNRLEPMLLEWSENKNDFNVQRIINEFVFDAPPGADL